MVAGTLSGADEELLDMFISPRDDIAVVRISPRAPSSTTVVVWEPAPCGPDVPRMVQVYDADGAGKLMRLSSVIGGVLSCLVWPAHTHTSQPSYL